MNSLAYSTARRRFFSLTTLLLLHSPTTGSPFSTKSLRPNSSKPLSKLPPPKPKLKPQPIRPKLNEPLPCPVPPQSQNANTPNSNSSSDFVTLRDFITDPGLHPGPDLENALNHSGIEPSPELLLQIFNHFDSSPKPLYVIFLWAEKQPGYRFDVAVLNAMINALGKAREFGKAWALIHDKILGSDKPNLNTFAILIRRFARAGFQSRAINTFELASNLDFLKGSNLEQKLFEILLDSLCKEGLIRVASKCFANRRGQETSWIPSIRSFNILLNGWFRSRNLEQAEQLWMEIKRENIRPSIVTYGTLTEGYCRMGHVERAMGLIAEMRKEGVEPNAIVYNPVIDALGEAGRFKEALGLMERLLLLESGPTISTYNSLVKGFCKAGDLEGASKTLKIMINRQVMPSMATYNYFFRHYSKLGRIEEGMNLYSRIIESGYAPDRLTYHLLVKMLCEQGRLDLSMRVVEEMRSRGFDLDLATSTMLIHLQVKMNHHDIAFEGFEDLIRRGMVPQYVTYQKISFELRKQGKIEMAQKLSDLMSTVPHSKKVPNTFDLPRDLSHARRKSIMRKAVGLSEVLKTCKNPRKLVKRRSLRQTAVSKANRLDHG